MAGEWSMAKKIKAGTGAVLGLVGIVTLGFNAATWAEDKEQELKANMAAQIQNESLIQQGRAEVIHSAIRNKHAYDFYGQEANAAEEDLQELEQQVAEGVTLLPSQIRKMNKLPVDIAKLEEKQAQALERLSNPEAEDAT